MTNNPALDLFVQRAHELLQAGYAAMDAKVWNLNKEPEISGELTAEIRKLIDTRRRPWMRNWTPINDEPEDETGKPKEKRRLGNRRKRPDIKLKFSGLRETFYFRFEAKRLAGTGDYADLISHEDGLGRFLRKVYGREDIAGGLLAYVQSESVQAHVERVRTALESNGKKYRVHRAGTWTSIIWEGGPEHCFRVIHSRQRGAPILMFYTFLFFG